MAFENLSERLFLLSDAFMAGLSAVKSVSTTIGCVVTLRHVSYN